MPHGQSEQPDEPHGLIDALTVVAGDEHGGQLRSGECRCPRQRFADPAATVGRTDRHPLDIVHTVADPSPDVATVAPSTRPTKSRIEASRTLRSAIPDDSPPGIG